MIEVGRNSIIIRNVDLEGSEFKKFNYNFSIYDSVVFKYTMSAFTIIDNDIYIPSTVGVGQVTRFFPGKKVTFNNLTAKSQKISFKMKNFPRDELQREALQFLSQMKNDYKIRNRLLALPTGNGKTFLTISLASILERKTMVVIDTLELARQWKEQIMFHSDIKEEEIYLISGKESLDALNKKSPYKFYIAVHKTLGTLIDEDPNGINRLMNTLGIGFRVIDEAHTNFKNTCQIDALSNVEYTLYLTATPSRSSFREEDLYGRVYRRVPYYNGGELAKKNYHTVILGYMDSAPPQDVQMSVSTKHGLSVPRWANYIEEYAYDTLYTNIYTLLTEFEVLERDKKTVIMLPLISLIKKVAKDLEADLKEEIGVYIGEKSAKDKEDALTKKIIITNDKMFDKAIDLPDLEVLINYVPLRSTVKLEQIIGRLRYGKGKSSVFIDITDKGFKQTLNQQRTRKTFYRKFARKIIELKNLEKQN